MYCLTYINYVIQCSSRKNVRKTHLDTTLSAPGFCLSGKPIGNCLYFLKITDIIPVWLLKTSLFDAWGNSGQHNSAKDSLNLIDVRSNAAGFNQPPSFLPNFSSRIIFNYAACSCDRRVVIGFLSRELYLHSLLEPTKGRCNLYTWLNKEIRWDCCDTDSPGDILSLQRTSDSAWRRSLKLWTNN